MHPADALSILRRLPRLVVVAQATPAGGSPAPMPSVGIAQGKAMGQSTIVARPVNFTPSKGVVKSVRTERPFQTRRNRESDPGVVHENLALPPTQAPMDGNEAAALMAYQMSDVSFIYPVSSPCWPP